MIQLEDCIDCLLFFYPNFDFCFELDNSSRLNLARYNGLTVSSKDLGMKWGGDKKKMRSSELTRDDCRTIEHNRRLYPGDVQDMVFTTSSLPPIFEPNAPKETIYLNEEHLVKLTTNKLKKALCEKGLSDKGEKTSLNHMQRRQTYLLNGHQN